MRRNRKQYHHSTAPPLGDEKGNRGDADEILRLSLVMQQAQATKYEMQLAYYAGRE
jgi:hypothetical protein